MAAIRIVRRNTRIIAMNAAEIAATSRRRKPWRNWVSVMQGRIISCRSPTRTADVAFYVAFAAEDSVLSIEALLSMIPELIAAMLAPRGHRSNISLAALVRCSLDIAVVRAYTGGSACSTSTVHVDRVIAAEGMFA